MKYIVCVLYLIAYMSKKGYHIIMFYLHFEKVPPLFGLGFVTILLLLLLLYLSYIIRFWFILYPLFFTVITDRNIFNKCIYFDFVKAICTGIEKRPFNLLSYINSIAFPCSINQ